MWSFAKLQFYRTLLTTGQLLLISSNIFDVSLALSEIYQFSHNQLCKNSRNAICKRSLLLLWKCFKKTIIIIKNRSSVTFWGWCWLSEQSIFSRSSHPEVLCEKNAMNFLAKFREKCLYRRLSNIMGSRTASLFKKRPLHTCFLVNFLKLFEQFFYRTPVNGYLCFR